MSPVVITCTDQDPDGNPELVTVAYHVTDEHEASYAITSHLEWFPECSQRDIGFIPCDCFECRA